MAGIRGLHDGRDDEGDAGSGVRQLREIPQPRGGVDPEPRRAGTLQVQVLIFGSRVCVPVEDRRVDHRMR
jgi:hypothetical protein